MPGKEGSSCAQNPSCFPTVVSISGSLQSDFVGFCQRKSSETASGVKLRSGTIAVKYSKCCRVSASRWMMSCFAPHRNPLWPSLAWPHSEKRKKNPWITTLFDRRKLQFGINEAQTCLRPSCLLLKTGPAGEDEGGSQEKHLTSSQPPTQVQVGLLEFIFIL